MIDGDYTAILVFLTCSLNKKRQTENTEINFFGESSDLKYIYKPGCEYKNNAPNVSTKHPENHILFLGFQFSAHVLPAKLATSCNQHPGPSMAPVATGHSIDSSQSLLPVMCEH